MSPVSAAQRANAVRFLVTADAEPGLLPRLLQPFAKRDLIPEHVQARRDGPLLRVEILLHDPEPGYAHLIAGNLGQIIGVRDIRQLPSQKLPSQKLPSQAARAA